MKIFKARKKPIVVEVAEYFKGDKDIPKEIPTLEGNMQFDYNVDYIITGVKGEKYPIKKDIFAETYDVNVGDMNNKMSVKLLPQDYTLSVQFINVLIGLLNRTLISAFAGEGEEEGSEPFNLAEAIKQLIVNVANDNKLYVSYAPSTYVSKKVLDSFISDSEKEKGKDNKEE